MRRQPAASRRIRVTFAISASWPARDRLVARIANPIYREVIVRALGVRVAEYVDLDPPSFIKADGTLDDTRLFEQFAAFWREHGEILTPGMPYHEVAPQLVLMAYFQRVVNGGGFIDREYGIGRGRIDALIRWPYRDAAGTRQVQRIAMELKVWREGRPDPIEKALSQLEGYLDRLGLETGYLVIFDCRDDAPSMAERTRFEDATTPSHGWPVRVLRA